MADEVELLEGLLAQYGNDELPAEVTAPLLAVCASLRDARESLDAARASCVAFGEVARTYEDSADVMRELGRVLEAVSMAQRLVERGCAK